MTLLAHLVPRIASAEPAATRALAYILNKSKEATIAFLRPLQDVGINEFEPGLILAEEQQDGNFPDLTIRDTTGKVRLFVENKFWAGLQASQPEAYLKALPNRCSGAVLFIVPKGRVEPLWGELKARCGSRSAGEEVRSGGMIRLAVNDHWLAISSWHAMLTRLVDATSHDPDTAQDIAQLKGLTESMSVNAFQPFTESELTDVNVPRRILSYVELYDDIVARLRNDGVASTKGLRTAARGSRAGRYLKLHSRFTVWLGVNYSAWKNWGRSPMWLTWWMKNCPSCIAQLPPKRLASHFEGAKGNDSSLYIPIPLAVGADRSRVIEHAADQVRGIGRKLLELFPEPDG
ncbi:MAG: hypothetical protein OXM02_12080 [Bacteroidota bacterium]|nr:hypothetical protein [Bacteroidota bacterium]